MEILSVDYILASFLIFVRVSSLMLTAPYFSSAAFPAQVKIFFALITSVLLYPVVPAQNVLIDTDSGALFLLTAIIIEILVGAALGLVGQIIFAGLELAGRLISLKIALGFASMVDTMTQQQSTIVSNLFNMLAVLVFLSIDGEKIYLNALVHSFELVPLQQAEIQLAGPFMLELATYLFVIGVQITAPFLIVLFLIDLSLAIFARIMPQANIMFIALPIKIGTGFILLYLVAPYLPVAFEMMFTRMFDFLEEFVGLMMPMP
ncbi:flagellar biosynthetic protein FliR [Rhodohalobacter sp. SW132]|uniref:flagellar biosynthetic protein FliR n=1 Tax=Rhodohalobacter sp. SW132 TaxID=2293433 RepID=UPI000E24CB57|nr:flagellar biosynthetic protein FliR [Rhodohalobacter sp. SW132]REL38668.1 flagellar biosynthetic protein FliR [Rhodohalobacter sp. SW132]